MSAFSYADRAFYPPPVQPFTSPPNPILDALAALARYIPAEGLALYIAIAAFAAQLARAAATAGIRVVAPA